MSNGAGGPSRSWQEVLAAVVLAIVFTIVAKVLTDRVLGIAQGLEVDQALLVLMEGTVFLLVTGATLGAELLHTYRAILHGHDVHVELKTFRPVFAAMVASYALYIALSRLAKMLPS
jgi:Kef-type K+ transport system membrane component KefB